MKSKEDRDSLQRQLSQESFGGGIKHHPRQNKKSTNFFIKGVDTSITTDKIQSFKAKDINLTEIRRLLNRETGRPT